MKKLLLFPFLFIFFLGVGIYVYYLYKFPKYPGGSHLFDHYPKDIILKTGGQLSTPYKRLQHFLNFPPSLKKKDVIRIGAFGDSYTYGSEVNKTETYPYQLQQLFNKMFNKDSKKIEVLNFGIGGVSFQEQFFLWEKYAQKYKLDYILLGPKGFFVDRDMGFRKVPLFSYFMPPKDRFILSKNDTLQLIRIKGDSLKEKYKNYYRLIPSWTALYYDIRPFQVWEGLFPFLLRRIKNPFYYTQLSTTKESFMINKILLKKMKSKHNKRILFFTGSKETYNNYESLKKLYNLNYFDLGSARFYHMFSHKSSLGNELIAKIYFYALIGKKDFSLNVLSCDFREGTRTPPPHFAQTPERGLDQGLQEINTFSKDIKLDSVQSITIIRGGAESRTLLTLRQNASDHHYNNGTYKNKRIIGTKSFIGFFDKSDFLNSPYFPLPIQLKEGMKIHIRFSNEEWVTLGSIKSLDASGKFFNFHAPTSLEYRPYLISYFKLDKADLLLRQKIESAVQSPELFVENYKLGFLYKQLLPYTEKQGLRFVPVDGYDKSFLMMGASDGQVREKDFPDKFPLYIQYEMDDGRVYKSLIPDWICRKKQQQIYLNLPNFEPLNWH